MCAVYCVLCTVYELRANCCCYFYDGQTPVTNGELLLPVIVLVRDMVLVIVIVTGSVHQVTCSMCQPSYIRHRECCAA